MSAKIAEIEQTLRKMLNIDVDDTQRNSTCGAKNEYPCHREHIDSHKNILDSHSLSDLEKSLKHQPSGPPPISPFSRQKSRDRSKTMTNNVFKYDSDCCSVKKPSDYIGCQLSHPTQTFLAIGKNQTFENRDCSKTSTKLRKASRNHFTPHSEKGFEGTTLIVSNEEWPALPPRNPHEDQVIKVALSTKPKKNKYRSKKKSKGSTKSSLAIKTCDLVQQTMHHKDKAFGSSDAFSAVSPDKAVDLHYIASNDEICQQVQASSGVIPEHLSQNRIPIKGTKLKTVESGNMMANLGNHSVTELIRSSDKSTEYSPDSVNHCRQSIPSCPKKASELLEQYNLAIFDKSPKSLPPDEVMDIFREQQILPLKKKSSRHPNAHYFCHLCEYHCDNLSVCKKHISSVGHISLKEAEELDITLRQLPIPSEDQVDAINALLMSLIKEVGLTDEDVAVRRNIVKELNDNLLEHLPEGCKLVLYGSSESGIGLKGCYVDIDLFVPSDANINPAQALVCAHDGIVQMSFIYDSVKTDWGAKWPVIYFVHRTTLLLCVLGLNGSDACKTSQLIRNYVQFDRRVYILCTLFRYWAKECGIDKQKEGTLSPHAFDLMVIYYLQQLEIPLLPVLHGMSESDTYLDAEEAAKFWKTKNEKSVGFLWVELFRYYSLIYPSSGLVISIRERSPVSVTKRNWRGQKLAIEDPFLFKRNLARSVSSRKIYSFILSCFKLTFKYFAIPQTANGPLFDHIPRPVSHTSGLESKVQSSTKNCSFECKSLLETGDRNLTKSDVEELLKHFTAKVKNEQKLEPDVTTSQDTIEQKTICSLLNDESNGTSLGSNKHSLVVGKEEKSCIQVVKEVQISVRKFDNMDSSDAEDDADSSEECDEGDALHLDDKAENYNDSKEGKCDDNSGKNTTSKAHRSKKETAKCCQLLPTPTEIKELINGMQKDDYKYTFRWHLLTGGKKPAIECSICQKEGHLKQNCPEDQLPELQPLPPPHRHFIDAITRACYRIEGTFKPSVYELENRKRILNELSAFISKTYPDAHLELFGSSCNGFGFKGSDLDICLTFKNNEKGEGLNVVEIITTLAEKLKKCKSFYQVIAIPTAKVPIVRFTHRSTRLECDISLYNALAQHNTRMLYLYSQIDERVHLLAYTMKYFAKLCGIGDASKGSLSSYAYNLMVLYFLQRTQPPIIPVLQELYDHTMASSPKVIVDGWNAWYFNDLNCLDEVWPHRGKNKDSVGELWLGLLRFYTEMFDFKKHVISIRQLKILTRFEKLWNSKCIAIEDPFELAHNLGMGVSRKMNTFIMKTFIYGRSVFGNSITTLPPGYRNIEEFLFDPRLLTDGPPPNDRCCRVCGCIGHIARDCPRKRGANGRSNRENEKKSRLLNEVSTNLVKQSKFRQEIVKHSASEISKTQNSPPVNSPFQQHQWKRSSSSVSRQSSSQSTPSTPHNVAPLLKDAVTSAVPTVKNYSAPENSFSLLQSCVLPCSNVSSPKNRMEEDISSIKKLVPSVQGDALVDKGVTRKEIEQKVSDTHMTVVGNSPQSGFNNVPSSSFPSPRLSPYLVSNNDDIACKTGILRGHQNTYGPFNFDPDLKHPINNSNSNVAHVSSVIPKVYSSTSLPTSTRHPLQQMAESDLGLQRHWPVQNAPPPFAVPSSPISFSQRFPSLSDPRSNSKVYMSRSANQIGSHGVSRPMGVTLAQQFYLHHTRPYRMGQNVVRSFPTPNIASSALPQLLVGIDNALLGPMVLAPRQTDTSPSSQGNCPTADQGETVVENTVPHLSR